MKDDIQIFISYAREDQPRVEALYQKLVAAGYKPWLDREHILPGQMWESEIKKALMQSDFVLVCLSATSINKRGFLQKEIKQALERAQEKLEGDIYLIPARLDHCDVPDALTAIQWVDLFEDEGVGKLLRSIETQSKKLGKTPTPPQPKNEMIAQVASRTGGRSKPWNWPGRRTAILIGSSQFDKEPKLKPLKCPENDVDGMYDILASSEFGGFEDPFVFKNADHHTILGQIEETLREARSDDQVLIYYSGHGETDLPGRLYLPAADTQIHRLFSTSIPFETLHGMIEHCHCNKIMLILDCCYGGAAGKSFLKGNVDEQLKRLSRGRGVYILMASTASQTMLEKEADDHSLLTKHIIGGILTGEAACGKNSLVTIEDLYNYVCRRVATEGHHEPMRWALNVRGEELIIARAGKSSLDTKSKTEDRPLTPRPEQNSASQPQLPEPVALPARKSVPKTSAQIGPANSYIEDLNGMPLEMVLVPAGRFRMGSSKYDDERPLQEVNVPAFYIGKCQITQAQWETVMGNNPSRFKGDDLPVENVGWLDAKEFCKKLQQITKKIYRLPSEAEWEYACRAGTAGDHAGVLDAMAWYSSNSGGKTHPVGQKQPNTFGLHDMHGNIWEWCEDKLHLHYKGAPTDGSAWVSGGDTLRIFRGGSWDSTEDGCRSAARPDIKIMDLDDLFIGVRVVRTK